MALTNDQARKKVMLPPEVKQYLADRLDNESFLLRKDLTIIELENGVQAMNRIIAEKPYLVILFAEMKGMKGYDICRILKRDRDLRNTIFVLVSDLAHAEGYRRLCLDAKCDAFEILHPSSNMLLERVAKLLQIQLRKETRVEVEMDVDSPNFHDPARGTMKNLSVSGMMVEVEKCSFERGYPLVLHVTIDGQELEIHAEVRRMFFRDRTNSYELGVEFKNLPPSYQRVIEDYIQSQLAQQKQAS